MDVEEDSEIFEAPANLSKPADLIIDTLRKDAHQLSAHPDDGLRSKITTYIRKHVRGERSVSSSAEVVLSGPLTMTRPLSTFARDTIQIAVFNACVLLLEEGVFAGRISADIIDILISAVDVMSQKNVAELCIACTDALKNGVIQCGASLDILPKLLAVVTAFSCIFF